LTRQTIEKSRDGHDFQNPARKLVGSTKLANTCFNRSRQLQVGAIDYF
jgi:hypothetical protein